MTARRHALQFRPAALRQLRKLPKDALRRIRTATEGLRDEPHPEGAAKLDVLVVTVVRVGHRREVYRR